MLIIIYKKNQNKKINAIINYIFKMNFTHHDLYFRKYKQHSLDQTSQFQDINRRYSNLIKSDHLYLYIISHSRHLFHFYFQKFDGLLLTFELLHHLKVSAFQLIHFHLSLKLTFFTCYHLSNLHPQLLFENYLIVLI